MNVESTLKSCYVGPLVENSPNTQRRNSANLVNNARRKDSSTLLRKESSTLIVPKTIKMAEGEQSLLCSLLQQVVASWRVTAQVDRPTAMPFSIQFFQ